MKIGFTEEFGEWFEGLTSKQKYASTAHITRLAALGHNIREPHSKSIGDGIFELRPTANKLEIRIFYAYHDGALLLVGGIKSGTNDKRFINEHKSKAIAAYEKHKNK